MTAKEMRELIDLLALDLDWLEEFCPDLPMRYHIQKAVDYLVKICPPRDSVMRIAE